MENKKKILSSLVTIVVLLLCIFMILANYMAGPYVTDIEVKDSKRFEDKVVFNVEVKSPIYKIDKNVWCYITTDRYVPTDSDPGWVKADNGYCSFTTSAGIYNVYVKDSYGNINDIKTQNVEINKVLSVNTNKDVIYMYKGRKELLSYNLVTLGNVDKTVTWKSENENIATVDENGAVKGVGIGRTYVNAISSTGAVGKVEVIVSSYITKPKINNSRAYVKCGQFSLDDAQMLDKVLADRINDAGEGTRAGVIAAARFLTLELSYKIPYFYENGRLNNYEPYLHVDAEGRYYHKGLYLHESKYEDLSSIFVGPATWGCPLKNFTNWGPYVSGKKYPNGLDCSGFVTWALLNGGFDVGDIGAGASKKHYDLDDIGTKVTITNSLMKSGKVKVGDLIGNNGHMAILAGWDDNNYYIAESLNTTKGVVMTTVPKNKLVGKSIYKYIILMDKVYKEDGNYTNMWE